MRFYILDSDKISPIRILGKKSSYKQVATYLKKELAGDGVKPPKSKSEISKNLGISRPTIDKYLKLADDLGIEFTHFKKTANEKITLSDAEFLANPYVEKWINNMKTRTPNGKEFGGMKNYIRGFWAVCKTLKVNPELFISGSTLDEVLEQGRTLMRNYMELYKEKKAEIAYSKDWSLENINLESVRYRYSKHVRDFMKIHGYSYPAGETGIMSQSITAMHGKYSDIKIPEEVHQKIKAELIDRFGLDSDEFRFYCYGIEAFPRHRSLYDTNAAFDEVQLATRTIFEMENFESKTSHYKRGIWKKHIFDKDLQESIRLVSKRSKFLIENRQFYPFDRHMKKILKELYKKYGLCPQGQRKMGDEDSSYFIRKPMHSLRHAGAQRLLLATDWNVSYVAKRGWKKTQELIDSYGEMPLQQELKTMDQVNF